jgi:hypothetical protein
MIYFPFYEILDGSDTLDYVQRVEPSASGGRKIANSLLDRLYGQSHGQINGQTHGLCSTAMEIPHGLKMSGRI